MRWQKFISNILHPVVVPTIGIILYFIFSPIRLSRHQQYTLFIIVFTTTYIIPILLLLVLKKIGSIRSYHLNGIQERKIPIFFMMTLYYMLGKFFLETSAIRDLSYLFFGVVFGLGIIYMLFITKVKVSIHMLSIGSAIGFFLLFELLHDVYTLPIVIVLLLLSGALGSSRIHLKAHSPKEVYIGFFIGIFNPFLAFYIL